MNDNTIIYFMTKLFSTLDSDNPTQSLQKVMKKIADIGRNPQYTDTYKQFISLFDESIAEIESTDPETWSVISNRALDNIMRAIVQNTFQGSDELRNQIIDAIQKSEVMSERYAAMFEDIRPIHTFSLEKDGEVFKHFSIRIGDSHVIPRIKPGKYSLNYANGRHLWHEILTTTHLVWKQAFPGENYTMAADTGETVERPSYNEPVLHGEITVQVLPGLETGTLRITLHETTT